MAKPTFSQRAKIRQEIHNLLEQAFELERKAQRLQRELDRDTDIAARAALESSND